nr:immunoglobulin heavy chain junction region [Macaca mulatta]MOV56700.1 immunoglobulin heavy chain junction region [Macaca mulatta]MOV56934.1 immunoglobulin heavy chain junction region [Macaca mulatta]MOV57161.1 immunoglobulin heavy chain junction region [Macaca mulatta]MOV60705.1 immunoglobulin heavy chain junction region [Macaca mulatta]
CAKEGEYCTDSNCYLGRFEVW